MACTILSVYGAAGAAAELSVTVHQLSGDIVVGAVVVAEPAKPATGVRSTLKGTINQKNLMFTPEVLVIRTGTTVDFPNGDPVRHQVYSFSSAKKFQLSLYSGSAHAPVVFDKPGLVTLGCNIHDSMMGYIYVTDSPWFGRTDKAGSVHMRELPAGDYTVRIWHPRIKDSVDSLHQKVTMLVAGKQQLEFKLQKPLSGLTHSNGAVKQWEDY
jgi:plastocyanin